MKTRISKIKKTGLRILLTIAILSVGLIPTWVFCLFHWILAPHGFWQQLVMAGVGLVCLGFLQLVFAIIMLALLLGIWTGSFE